MTDTDAYQDAPDEPLTLGPATAARNRLLPEGRVNGPMPWVIAIMVFLSVLAMAAGIGLATGVMQLRSQLLGGFTVQIVSADATRQGRQVAMAVEHLRASPAVANVSVVPEHVLAEQMRPWLGDDIREAGLPLPALIEVRTRTGQVDIDALRTGLRRIAPDARVEADAGFLAPIEHMMRSMMWMAAAIVLLMLLATAAVVILAARGAHDAHRGTIDILHLLGATDIQIARLFQRRTALDAAFGGIIGSLIAIGLILFIQSRGADDATELTHLVRLPVWGWAVLPMVPLCGVLVAMVAARTTVRRALERNL